MMGDIGKHCPVIKDFLAIKNAALAVRTFS